MKNLILALALITPLTVGITACSSTSIKPLEEMTELEYSKWKMYVQLGVKIGANRLLQEGTVTEDQLDIAAGAIEGITQPVTTGAKSLLVPALRNAGLNSDEIEFILLVAEQELLARGALDWINPETGVLELSPRTKEMLSIIVLSLRTAGLVTPEEQFQSNEMRADFCCPGKHI